MHLPRVGIFRSSPKGSVHLNHVVLVTGDIVRPLCIRNPLKHGHFLEPDARLTCTSCSRGGWSNTLSYLGSMCNKDAT